MDYNYTICLICCEDEVLYILDDKEGKFEFIENRDITNEYGEIIRNGYTIWRAYVNNIEDVVWSDSDYNEWLIDEFAIDNNGIIHPTTWKVKE